jgi:uncharacterized protein (DUF1778 family)
MDNVATNSVKDVWINIRINPRIREEFKIAAELRGASMSGLIHQFIVKTIREEKGVNPEAFLEDTAEAEDEILPIIDTRTPEGRRQAASVTQFTRRGSKKQA